MIVVRKKYKTIHKVIQCAMADLKGVKILVIEDMQELLIFHKRLLSI